MRDDGGHLPDGGLGVHADVVAIAERASSGVLLCGGVDNLGWVARASLLIYVLILVRQSNLSNEALKINSLQCSSNTVFASLSIVEAGSIRAVSYTHLTLPTTPYV